MKFLENLLLSRNKTKYEIAKNSSLSWSTVSDIFSGKISLEKCKGNTLYELSQSLDCTIEYLIIGSRLHDIMVRYDKGEFLTKNSYYRDLISLIPFDVVLGFNSAIEYHNLTNGIEGYEIDVYSPIDLPYPFNIHKADNFEELIVEEKNGILVTSVSQTFNDLLSYDITDPQILYEGLGKYYYKNGSSFSDLDLSASALQRFEEIRDYAISYWEED